MSIGTVLTLDRCRIISYEAFDAGWIRSMNGSLSLSVTSAEMIDPCRPSPDDLFHHSWMTIAGCIRSRSGAAIAAKT